MIYSRTVILAAFLSGFLFSACSSDPISPVDGGRDADVDTIFDADATDRDADTPNNDGGPDADQIVDSDEPQQGDADEPDGDTSDCPGPGCTCVTVPHDSARSCWHSFGGLYGPGACSGSYQCCDGSWRSGISVCGSCSCTETTGTEGCVAADDGDEVCFPEFDGTASPLPADVIELMTDVSWREGCPVSLGSLSLIEMPHWGFDESIHRGQMVVATSVSDDVLDVFQRIYEARFPIERMRLVDEYDADDDRSMADNNTSAFNCRAISGGSSWSQHSYGTAIDINPVQNPYVRGSTILPPAGADYTDRSNVRMGMIVEPGPVTAAFDAVDWGWGGRWTSFKDYQHFSESGN